MFTQPLSLPDVAGVLRPEAGNPGVARVRVSPGVGQPPRRPEQARHDRVQEAQGRDHLPPMMRLSQYSQLNELVLLMCHGCQLSSICLKFRFFAPMMLFCCG